MNFPSAKKIPLHVDSVWYLILIVIPSTQSTCISDNNIANAHDPIFFMFTSVH